MPEIIPTYRQQVATQATPFAAQAPLSLGNVPDIGQGVSNLGRGLFSLGLAKREEEQRQALIDEKQRQQMLKDAWESELLKQEADLTEKYYNIRNTAIQVSTNAMTSAQKEKAMELYWQSLSEIYESEDYNPDVVNEFRIKMADDTSRFFENQIKDIHSQTVEEGRAATINAVEVLARNREFDMAKELINASKIPIKDRKQLLEDIFEKTQLDEIGARAEIEPKIVKADIERERAILSGKEKGERKYPNLTDKQLDDAYKQAIDWDKVRELEIDRAYDAEKNNFFTKLHEDLIEAVDKGNVMPDINAIAEETFGNASYTQRGKNIMEDIARARSIVRDTYDYQFNGDYSAGVSEEAFNIEIDAVKAANGDISQGEFSAKVREAIINKDIPKRLGMDMIANNIEDANRWKNKFLSNVKGEVFSAVAPGVDALLAQVRAGGRGTDVLEADIVEARAQKDLAYSLIQELSDYIKGENVSLDMAENRLRRQLLPKYIKMRKFAIQRFEAKYTTEPVYDQIPKDLWNDSDPEIKARWIDLSKNRVDYKNAKRIILEEFK